MRLGPGLCTMIFFAICPGHSHRLLPLPMCRSPVLVPSPLREGTSHAAGGPCIQLLYFHASIRLSCLPSLSSLLVYFMNSPQAFPFSNQRLWEFIILPKESVCPISPTHALHVYPLIPLSSHISFSPFLYQGFDFLSFQGLHMPCISLFLISLTGSQLLGSCFLSSDLKQNQWLSIQKSVLNITADQMQQPMAPCHRQIMQRQASSYSFTLLL